MELGLGSPAVAAAVGQAFPRPVEVAGGGRGRNALAAAGDDIREI